MRRFLWLFVVALLAGGTAFVLTQRIRHACCPDEDTWLQKEFSVSAAQLAAIKKIRADYAPVCAEHCRKLTAARQQLATLKAAGDTTSPAYQAARAQRDAIAQECADATRAHIAAIAAQMSADEGRRYLAVVSPKLTAPAATTDAVPAR